MVTKSGTPFGTTQRRPPVSYTRGRGGKGSLRTALVQSESRHELNPMCLARTSGEVRRALNRRQIE